MLDRLAYEQELVEAELRLLRLNEVEASQAQVRCAKVVEAYTVVMEHLLENESRIREFMEDLSTEKYDPIIPDISTIMGVSLFEGKVPNYARGRRLAYRMVRPTCTHVDDAFSRFAESLMSTPGVSPEAAEEIAAELGLLVVEVKARGTEVLRRALIYACHRWVDSPQDQTEKTKPQHNADHTN